MGMTRRDALKGLGAAVGAAAIGCGGSADLGPDPLPDGASPPRKKQERREAKAQAALASLHRWIEIHEAGVPAGSSG